MVGLVLGNQGLCGRSAIFVNSLSHGAIAIKCAVSWQSTNFHWEVAAFDLAMEHIVHTTLPASSVGKVAAMQHRWLIKYEINFGGPGGITPMQDSVMCMLATIYLAT